MMNKANIALISVGLIVILFAVFCSPIIAEVHSVIWRIIIGLLGCFSLVSGICKIACKK